jgi:hypothetical protein
VHDMRTLRARMLMRLFTIEGVVPVEVLGASVTG